MTTTRMRTARWIASGLALVALLPTTGAAQSNRMFKDAWFWGVKAGLMSFSTVTAGTTTRPLLGAEWLITRSRGGLLVSVDQTYFNTSSAVADNQGNQFMVSVHDLRRYSAAALAFPVAYGSLRPYGGVGFSLNLIQRAAIRDQITDPDQDATVRARVADEKDRASFLVLAGVQAQYRRFSAFGQATYMPTQARFLLNGRPAYLIEGGIRVNVGRSIEPM